MYAKIFTDFAVRVFGYSFTDSLAITTQRPQIGKSAYFWATVNTISEYFNCLLIGTEAYKFCLKLCEFQQALLFDNGN